MPSMWKKQKGNRISRLVSDLQTTPKRGNSLVVETGFPTSIADLFVKNHDKLKKSSKKKYRSKQPPSSPSTPMTPPTTYLYDLPSPVTPSPVPLSPFPVSDSHVSLSSLDFPSCSIDVENKELVARKFDSDSCVDEIVPRRNSSVELNRFRRNYGCEVEEGERYGKRGSNPKNGIWLLVLKGSVVVVVSFYTRSFVLGVSIGAFLFCILEYLGNSVFGIFKPCVDLKRKLGGLPPNRGVSRPRRVVDKKNGKKAQEGGLKGGTGIGLESDKDFGENGVVSTRTIEPKVETIDSLRRGNEVGVGNDPVSRWGFEADDGGDVALKGDMEQGNVDSTFQKGKSSKLEKEFKKMISEIEVVEPNSCESSCTSPIPCELLGIKGAIESGEEGSEDSDMVNQKGKKGKKFWRKFVPKQSKKYKHKNHKGQDETSGAPEVPLNSIEEILPESEEGSELEDELEMVLKVATSSSLSLPSLDEQEREGVEQNIVVTSHGINTEMLHTEDSAKSSRMMKKRGRNLRSLGFLGIVLAGLMGGRVFALVLTVICLLVFKMVRG